MLSYEYGFIYGSYHYYTLIKTIYFDHYQNECEIKHLGDKDIYYVCDTTIDLEKFPELIFILLLLLKKNYGKNLIINIIFLLYF